MRALDILRRVDLIACEDTRHTRTLLARHGIAGKLVSFHKFNEGRAAAGLVSRLTGGESIALVSDGGTPAVSDPGYRLVREALDAGVTVTPVPGPSAFVAAVSASGLPSESLAFRGFLPHRAGERRRLLAAIKDDPATQVFYESPHRIVASLADLAEILGSRQAAVARELTKRFETWYRGTLPDVAARVAEGTVKGEYCLVIEGAAKAKSRARTTTTSAGAGVADGDANGAAAAGPGSGQDAEAGSDEALTAEDSSPVSEESDSLHRELSAADLPERYQIALREGLDRRQALKRAAHECGLTRKEAYALMHASRT